MSLEKGPLVLLRPCLLLSLFIYVGMADPGITPMACTDKLFDHSDVHRIDVQLTDADWTGILADPVSKA